ncbi:MAG: elongation factor P [Patescibacteria group bacterium]
MAFGITDLKKGTIFELNDIPYKVVEYSQKVMGRGGSIVNVKIKSLIDGKVLEKTFKGNESISPAHVDNSNAQFTYQDGSTYNFMDQESFENYEVDSATIDDIIGYFKEGDAVTVQKYNGKVISVSLPKNVYLKVTYAEDAVKGDTSSALTKNAELETGIKVRVPAFIKTGDEISIDVATGAYRERKKN